VKFTECSLAGAYVVEAEPIKDERGFFARVWCRQEFQRLGLCALIEQSSVSFNERRGTLRGMHFQVSPHEEVKVVRCTQGSIHDVIVDLRAESPTYCQWFAMELSAQNGKMMYVPPGFAHGFQTLSDRSEVFYQISEAYHPDSARGVRWNDPAFRIEWPIPQPFLSTRDRRFPDFFSSLSTASARVEA